MKVYLADLYYDQLHPKPSVPLNIGYIAAYVAKKFGGAVEIKLFKSPVALLDAVDAAPPDLLGFSNYIWNERLSAFCAGYVKKVSPATVTLIGGPNFRTDSEGIRSFLDNYPQFDYCVLFSGEEATARLLEHLIACDLENRKRGMAIDECMTLASDGSLVGTPKAEPMNDLDDIPSPYLTGFLDAFLDDRYLLMIETNRGCPYQCTFCVWGISALSKLKKFSSQRVSDEIFYIRDFYKEKFKREERRGENISAPDSWIVADANFGILKRDEEFARHLRSIYDQDPRIIPNTEIWWAKNPNQTMVNVAKTLRNMTKGYIAFQSLDENVLINIKRKNISTEKLMDYSAKIKPYVADIHTDLLVGLPGESKESHLNSYRSALALGFSSIGGGEVRILPGSEMDHDDYREKFGLKTKWRLSEADIGTWRDEFVFELEEGVRETQMMSEESMLELRLLRAVLFTVITLGYMRPIVAASFRNDRLDLVSLSEWIVATATSSLGDIFDTFRFVAEEEWYETKEAAIKAYSDASTQKRILENPPMKLNMWLPAALVNNSEAEDEFFQIVDAYLIKNEFQRNVVNDLIKLTRATHVIGPLVGDQDLLEKSVTVSPETLEMLEEAKWLSPGHGVNVALALDADKREVFKALKTFLYERRAARKANRNSVLELALSIGRLPNVQLLPVHGC